MNWILLCVAFALVLIETTFAVSDFPCTIYSGECKADVTHDDDDESVSLEVSCQCKYRRDVSKNLTALSPIRCPSIPQNVEFKHLKKSKLRIQNCNVQEENFPLELLRILRRSKKFEILIENVGHLRLVSDKLIEEAHPSIDALFNNSFISGLGQGWFTNTDYVSLKVHNCSIGVLETALIGYYNSTAQVDIKFENTLIQTIKNFAFQLPPSGKLSFSGGRIGQLETDAMAGGSEIAFEGAKIWNIQTTAINVFGLKEFLLDSCIIAKIDNDALVEHQISSAETQKYNVKKVSVTKNKFIWTNGDAFKSLCTTEDFDFKDNFFSNVTSFLTLKSRICSISRHWWHSVDNNGFNCSHCSSLSERVDEQVCALYETGWCLCDGNSKPSEKDEDENAPCKTPYTHFLADKCSHTQQFREYMKQCEIFAQNGKGFSPKSLIRGPAAASSSNRFAMSAVFYVLLIVGNLF